MVILLLFKFKQSVGECNRGVLSLKACSFKTDSVFIADYTHSLPTLLF